MGSLIGSSFIKLPMELGVIGFKHWCQELLWCTRFWNRSPVSFLCKHTPILHFAHIVFSLTHTQKHIYKWHKHLSRQMVHSHKTSSHKPLLDFSCFLHVVDSCQFFDHSWSESWDAKALRNVNVLCKGGIHAAT